MERPGRWSTAILIVLLGPVVLVIMLPLAVAASVLMYLLSVVWGAWYLLLSLARPSRGLPRLPALREPHFRKWPSPWHKV